MPQPGSTAPLPPAGKLGPLDYVVVYDVHTNQPHRVTLRDLAAFVNAGRAAVPAKA